MLCSNLHGTTLFAFLFVHVLYFNWTQINETNEQTAVDVKHWNEARQLMWHLLHPDARRLGVHVIFFCFGLSPYAKRKQTNGSWCHWNKRETAVQLMWNTEQFMLYSGFAFKHGEREFTAKMSQHMFWRATSKMSERKTSGDTTVETSQVQCLAELFSFSGVCEGWNSFSN